MAQDNALWVTQVSPKRLLAFDKVTMSRRCVGKSMVNVLPRAPSGTAVDGHTAMFPAGDRGTDHYPNRCSFKYPVRETSNCLDGT